MWKWLRGFLGMEERAHVAVLSSAVWGDDALQRELFAAGGSLKGDSIGQDGHPRLIVECGKHTGLDRVSAILEAAGIEHEPVEWCRDRGAYFTDLEWAVLMSGMEELNDGRSLRGRSW